MAEEDIDADPEIRRFAARLSALPVEHRRMVIASLFHVADAIETAIEVKLERSFVAGVPRLSGEDLALFLPRRL